MKATLLVACVTVLSGVQLLAEGEKIFGGVGIFLAGTEIIRGTDVVDVVPSGARVRFVLAGTPACKSGVKAGDLITQIDSKPVCGHTLSEIIEWLRGSVGSEVSLSISRKGRAQPLIIKIVRQEIHFRVHTTLPKCEYN